MDTCSSFILVEGEESRQGTDAWLKFREGKIGASDAPSVMGLNPWETKLECWERFILGKKKETTPAMERGHKFESRARQLYCDIFEKSFYPVVAQSSQHPSLIASLDGWDGEMILEIKCPGKETHLMARRGEIPEHYKCQMQHQMMVMGCQRADYCSYDYLTDSIAVNHLDRDEEFIGKLLSTELAFIQSLVDFQPPEATDKDWVEINDPELNLMAETLKDLIKQTGVIEKIKEDLRKMIIEKLKHPRSLVKELRIQKVVAKGRIDYEGLLKKYNIQDADSFRKPSIETWRVSIDN